MLQEDHKEISSGKKKDDEGYMARVELDQIERSIQKLRKVIKTSDHQLPAWVQSKITRAADYIDTASEYLQSDEKLGEEISPTINSKKHKDISRQEKIRALTKSSNSNEANVAKSKLRPSAAVSLPSIKKEEKSLVQKIIDEHCGCSEEKKSCNKTKKGKNCPVHGMKDCYMNEERDPKGPVQPYKSPEEIAKKHGVSLESIKKQLEMGIKVEGEHTSDKSSAKITALQHLDEVPNYYTKLKKVESKKNVTEATRIKAQTGNIVAVTLSWRGKYYYVQMFFPQSKMPSKSDVTFEVQKIYPDSRVVAFKISELSPGQPLIQISNTPSKNYLLNNKTVGEEVEILDEKKSEMACNKPKAQAHGSGEQGKSHVVKACDNGKEKLIRFGQLGVKGSPKKKGESEEYASRRHRFKTRHAKNIAKGKMSAAYWANKVKW